MLLFQFEGVAEQWLSADDFANLREWSGHPDVDAVVARLAEPGALTAALGIYRDSLPPAACLAAAGAAAGRGADARGLVERGPLPDRGADDRVRGVRRRAVDATPGWRTPGTGCSWTGRMRSTSCCWTSWPGSRAPARV